LFVEYRIYVEDPATNATKTGHEICPFAEEDAEAEGAGEEIEEEVSTTEIPHLPARSR
jgi:hypothetical protein